MSVFAHRQRLLPVTALLASAAFALAPVASQADAPVASGPAPLRAGAAPPALPPHPGDITPLQPCAATEPAFECDRRAILAMVGEFELRADFRETVILDADYQRRASQADGGLELVLLIADTGRSISLQHIRISRHVEPVKRWRQDWVFETPAHWRYVGGQRFETYKREAPEIPASWTQLVFNASDAPSHAGSGRWNHRYGVSTWTGERTWHPLPRREYIARADYDLINGENRHTVTARGWTHEQDNTKMVRRDGAADRTLVREFGFTEYRRIGDAALAPGYLYFSRTAGFWAQVRARWDELLAAPGALVLAYAAGDEAMSDALIAAAEKVYAGTLDGPAAAQDPALWEGRVLGDGADAVPVSDAK